LNIFYNSSNTYAFVGLITYLFDSIINFGEEASAGPTLQPKFLPFPPPPKSPEQVEDEKLRNAQISSTIAPSFLTIGFLAIPSHLIYDVVSENALGLKHLQTLAGISPLEYWASKVSE